MILLGGGKVEGCLGVAVLYGGVSSMAQQEAAYLHPTGREQEGGKTGLYIVNAYSMFMHVWQGFIQGDTLGIPLQPEPEWHVFILTKRINKIYGLGGMGVI